MRISDWSSDVCSSDLAIYRLSHYVDKVAQGDPATILAAGYRASRSKHVPIGRIPKAQNLRVKHVQVGTGIIQLKVTPWKPARLYRFEYRKVGSAVWESILDSKSRLELHGLDSLQEYEFRVTYIGTEKIGRATCRERVLQYV